jgi:MoxR-like ATPase
MPDREAMRRFSRALAAYVDALRAWMIQERLRRPLPGPAVGPQVAADAFSIVAAFATADERTTPSEMTALYEASGHRRRHAGDDIESRMVVTAEAVDRISRMAAEDRVTGGRRAAAFVAHAVDLAEATCALDGVNEAEMQAVAGFRRVLEERLTNESVDASLEASLRGPASESVDLVMAELDRLVGLESVKSRISTMTNLLKVQRRRGEVGLPEVLGSRHMVFTGPPGTGKTTVARLFGRVLRALGYLPRGHLVEVTRSDLVAGFVGQTSIKADAAIDSAVDGVLFIDEAYALAPERAGGDYGEEAVAALVKRMEDRRERMVVIVAGYPDEMDRFLESNPGLASRFPEHIEFPPYARDELVEIFRRFAADAGYEPGPEAIDEVHRAVDSWDRGARTFGNARAVRNLFEDVVASHANRVVHERAFDRADLVRLTAGDVTAGASLG